MRGMLEGIGPLLVGGAVLRSRSIRGRGLREGDLAAQLEALENKYENVGFGSYPWFSPEGHGAHLVARSTDPVALEAAARDLVELVKSQGVVPELVDEGG
jgi:molybdopterin-biosynthesis enzyme MoeA-like protein